MKERKRKKTLSYSRIVSALKEVGLEPNNLVVLCSEDAYAIGFFHVDHYTHYSYYIYSFREGRGLNLKEITEERYMAIINSIKSPRSNELTDVEKLLMSQEKVTVEDLLNADKRGSRDR